MHAKISSTGISPITQIRADTFGDIFSQHPAHQNGGPQDTVNTVSGLDVFHGMILGKISLVVHSYLIIFNISRRRFQYLNFALCIVPIL